MAGSLVIGVTMPGGPYPEDSETRRRLRYAVLAALHTANYVPADERHLGYFVTGQNELRDGAVRPEVAALHAATLPLGRGGDREKYSEPPLPTLIPFERFQNQEAKGDEISILWLNEDVMAAATNPIQSLKWLQCQLNLSKSRFPVIGPQDSTTLINILNEVTNDNHNEDDKFSGKCRPDKPLPIYNFCASADEDILRNRVGFVEYKVEKMR